MDKSSPRRLAVQLHNRKHPAPTGVYLVLGLVALTAGIAIWMANHQPSKESQDLRKEIQASQRETQQAIDGFERVRQLSDAASKKLEAQLAKFQASGTKWEDCEECHGNGYVTIRTVKEDKSGYGENHFECKRCAGSGIVEKLLCRTCANTGRILTKNYWNGMERGLKLVICPACDGEFKKIDHPLSMIKTAICDSCKGTGLSESTDKAKGMECGRCGGRGKLED